MYSIIKRFFDLLFALILVAILLVPLLPIIIGLLATGEHYIFYLQQRIATISVYLDNILPMCQQYYSNIQLMKRRPLDYLHWPYDLYPTL